MRKRKVVPLHWPKGFKCLSNVHSIVHIPLGLATFAHCPSGGGDELAFYWPIGQEKREPIVVRVFHETYELAPFFSSFKHFERWQKRTGSDDLPFLPDQKVDPSSPEALNFQASALLKEKKIVPALAALEQAIVRLPEFTHVLVQLANQYRIRKDDDKALAFGLRALVSPPTFGRVDAKLLKWIQTKKTPPEEFRDNPIWISRKDLKWSLKVKGNSYEIFRDGIAAFFDDNQPVLGITLMQTYSEFIYWEAASTWRRLKYDADEWALLQEKRCAEYLGVTRRPNA